MPSDRKLYLRELPPLLERIKNLKVSRNKETDQCVEVTGVTHGWLFSMIRRIHPPIKITTRKTVDGKILVWRRQ